MQAEHTRASDFKSLLWNNNTFYCYLDKFMTPEKDKFFDIVFKKELEKVIANSFVLPNAEQIFREALTQTRASLSSTARDHLYNTTMNNLKLVLNSNGTFSIEIAKYKNKVVDFAFQTTPRCKVRNSSYEFAVISKNKILRDF